MVVAQLVEQSIPTLRDPRFESQHQQNSIFNMYFIQFEMTEIKRKKRQGMVHLKKEDKAYHLQGEFKPRSSRFLV